MKAMLTPSQTAHDVRKSNDSAGLNSITSHGGFHIMIGTGSGRPCARSTA